MQRHFLRVIRGEALVVTTEELEWYQAWKTLPGLAQSAVKPELSRPLQTADPLVRPMTSEKEKLKLVAQHRVSVKNILKRVAYLSRSEVVLLNKYATQLNAEFSNPLSQDQQNKIADFRAIIKVRNAPRFVSGGLPYTRR